MPRATAGCVDPDSIGIWESGLPIPVTSMAKPGRYLHSGDRTSVMAAATPPSLDPQRDPTISVTVTMLAIVAGWALARHVLADSASPGTAIARGNIQSGRIRSEAAFAKLCGACPIPASSGKTSRHRLNRGGNRQANAALYRVVITRMRSHSPTRTSRKRMAEGKGKMEIIRCLKRFVAREVFGYLCRTTDFPRRPLTALDLYRSINSFG